MDFADDQSPELRDPRTVHRRKSLREMAKPALVDGKSAVQTFCSKKMLLFLPQMIWVGAAFAYTSGLLVPIMSWHQELQHPDDPSGHPLEKKYLADCFYAMVFFGIGQVVAGYVMGRIIDKIGSRRSCFVNILMLGAVTTTQFLVIKRETFDWLSHTNCCLWGVLDACITTHSL